MGGMKSGTGDVWGSDDDDEEEEAGESVEESAVDESLDDAAGREQRSGADPTGDEGSSDASKGAQSGDSGASVSSRSAPPENDKADNGLSTGGGASNESSESSQPYVVRRMLKDKSVQFERDERLTFFVHDDVKTGEQELEAETQDLFGRDIPVFDIREAVYRAALQNRDDVVEELESMGYTRE